MCYVSRKKEKSPHLALEALYTVVYTESNICIHLLIQQEELIFAEADSTCQLLVVGVCTGSVHQSLCSFSPSPLSLLHYF